MRIRPDVYKRQNLSLAYLRASRGSIPFSRISKKDKEFFREQLSMLDMGLEDRMKQPVGLLSGGQRQALTLPVSYTHLDVYKRQV